MKMRCWLMGVLLMAGLAEASRPAVSRQEAEVLERAMRVAETNVAAAAGLLDEARAGGRGSAALDYSAGNLRAGEEAYEEAVAAYRVALGKVPEFVEARVGLARALALMEAWGEAETELRGVALREDAKEEVLLLYGYVLLELGRWVSAETIYRRAALAGGDSVEAYLGLARCFMAMERYAEAAGLAEELAGRAPENGVAWALLGDARLGLDQPEEARVALESARRLGVATPGMLLTLGEAYVAGGLAEAGAEVARGLDGTDAGPEGWLRMAGILLAAERGDEAAAWLDRYGNEVKEPGATYFRLRAEWGDLTGQEAEARAAREAWARLEPTNERVLLALGDAALREGKAAAAELWFDRARLANPGRVEPLLRLARLALDKEEYDTAIRHLEQALVLRGDPAIERTLQQVRRLVELR